MNKELVDVVHCCRKILHPVQAIQGEDLVLIVIVIINNIMIIIKNIRIIVIIVIMISRTS